MRGRFVTTKYRSRHDYETGCAIEVLRSENAFVRGGLEWLWQVVAGMIRNDEGGMSDHLGKGRLIVGNGDRDVSIEDTRLAGDETAWAELDAGYPRVEQTEAGAMIVLRATFAEDVANFDWLERGVTSVQGVLIDRSVLDHGRKAPGAIWTLDAELELLSRS